MSLQIFDLYERVLIPLTPPPAVVRIMELVMQGGETTEDFAKVLARDSELQYWIRLTVQRLGFDKRVSKLDQMITLLGQNRIRDLLIGRDIERRYVLPAETLRAKLLAQKEKASESGTASQAAGALDDLSETIPPLAEFAVYSEFARRAEEVAVTIRNSYPSQAFAGGVIFDYVKYFLRGVKTDDLQDTRLQKTDAYLEEIFLDGLRCGVAANEIIQKINIPHQRTVFVTALVHNIGKALLLAYSPKDFEKAFLGSTGAEKGTKRIESTEAETEVFDLDHAQVGSLYLGRLPYLVEIERSVDYHHKPHMLRFANPKLYALCCVLRVSGALVKLYERSRKEDSNTDKIRDQKLIASEDFKFLKLNEQDWNEIKANYALKLMKIGI